MEQLIRLNNDELFLTDGFHFTKIIDQAINNADVWEEYQEKTGKEIPIKIKDNRIFVYGELLGEIVVFNDAYLYYDIKGITKYSNIESLIRDLKRDISDKVLFIPTSLDVFALPSQSFMCHISKAHCNLYTITPESQMVEMVIRLFDMEPKFIRNIFFPDSGFMSLWECGTLEQQYAFIDWANRKYFSRSSFCIKENSIVFHGNNMDVVKNKLGGYYLDIDFKKFLDELRIPDRKTFVSMINRITGCERKYNGVFPEFGSKEELLKIISILIRNVYELCAKA